jgi:transcriptional regulator with XRE-family HTH domain
MPRRPSDPKLAALLGARLRRVREAAGISQQALADRAGSTAATISRFENGDLMPTVTTVATLARALGVPLAQMFDFESASADPADAEEATLLEQFRRLAPKYRSVVRGLIAAMLTSE